MGDIKENSRHKEYDDPYRVLAAHIVSNFSIAGVQRTLENSAYIKSLIIKDAKGMDINGPFLDCIDQEIVANDMIRKKNVYLKKLGEFYYSELDIERLRREIRRFAKELGITLD